MTQLLQQAFEKLKQLTPLEQDMVASLLLEEVADMEILKKKIALGVEQINSGKIIDSDTVFRKLRKKNQIYEASKRG